MEILNHFDPGAGPKFFNPYDFFNLIAHIVERLLGS